MGILDFLRKLPTVNEITGGFGERLAQFYASTLPGTLVLHDVLIDGSEQYKSQIDLLVIGSKGIYVVEVKTYTNAKIYGNTKNSKWYYYSHGHKYEIYSPIKQNKKHVEYLRSFLAPFGDIPCFSVITMICDDFKVTGDNGENTIICSSLPAMERAIYMIADGKPDVLDDAGKKAVYQYIQENQHVGREARTQHKENVITYQKNLEDLKEKKVCPYCKAELVLRKGKYGTFYGCSNYPKCKYILKEKS